LTPGSELYTFEGEPALATLVWRLGSAWRAASTAPVGGGIAPCEWVVNVQVPSEYARLDVETHVGEVAAALGLRGPGVGMLTAAPVAQVRAATDDGVDVEATVGLRLPVWAAAAPDPDPDQFELVATPGTVNIVAFVPVPHSDGALANLLCTATEAKVQALLEGGVPGTGTASDAVTVLCPPPADSVQPFGGPRSEYGARLARATHAAIGAGIGERTS
jgi:adenosylcobinamide amidohydrolase